MDASALHMLEHLHGKLRKHGKHLIYAARIPALLPDASGRILRPHRRGKRRGEPERRIATFEGIAEQNG